MALASAVEQAVAFDASVVEWAVACAVEMSNVVGTSAGLASAAIKVLST